ncbi:MAG TPA: hypothetical protein PK587_02675 [Syntrophales bacterium]|nr:hypothetical protein [Syntrophales bacterium]
MPKIPVDKVEPGMKLVKPVLNKSGMVLLAEGTELTEVWIERLHNMGIEQIHVEGQSKPLAPKEQVLEELSLRFKAVKDKPYMSTIMKAVREHIESLYDGS